MPKKRANHAIFVTVIAHGSLRVPIDTIGSNMRGACKARVSMKMRMKNISGEGLCPKRRRSINSQVRGKMDMNAIPCKAQGRFDGVAGLQIDHHRAVSSGTL